MDEARTGLKRDYLKSVPTTKFTLVGTTEDGFKVFIGADPTVEERESVGAVYMRPDGSVVTPEEWEQRQEIDRLLEAKIRENDVSILGNLLGRFFPNVDWDGPVEDTAARVVKYWEEFAGSNEYEFEATVFSATSGGMILVRDIEFVSLCQHHLLPFYGKAHVAYLPDQVMIGLSKIPRLVQHLAKRPQCQETLTRQIVEKLDEIVYGKGCAALVESRHTCLACRGARSHSASMSTAEVTGKFLKSKSVRAEFYSMLAREAL